MNNETRTAKRWTWKNWAAINECSSDIASVAFHAQDPYIDHLEAENERLKKKTNEIIGWFYAEACCLVDQGVDIRKEELPKILERLEKDLGGLEK